jgi:hypothetical protein
MKTWIDDPGPYVLLRDSKPRPRSLDRLAVLGDDADDE